MSKALFGTHALPPAVQLLDEVQRLRARVAELEEALAAAEAAARDGGPEHDLEHDLERTDVDPVHAPAGH